MSSQGVIVGALVAAAIATGVNCVDVKDGDQGTYGSPCGSSFHDLLQCGRETGGTDPAGGSSTGDRPATCAEGCGVLIGCRIPNPADLGECITDCEESAPSPLLLECIVDRGCDFPLCFRGES